MQERTMRRLQGHLCCQRDGRVQGPDHTAEAPGLPVCTLIHTGSAYIMAASDEGEEEAPGLKRRCSGVLCKAQSRLQSCCAVHSSQWVMTPPKLTILRMAARRLLQVGRFACSFCHSHKRASREWLGSCRRASSAFAASTPWRCCTSDSTTTPNRAPGGALLPAFSVLQELS